MRGGTGSLNQLGCPVVEIEVSGGVPGVRKRLSALLDTGFSGFLSIPILEAFPLGLMLRETINAVLADGSQQAKRTCRGSVHFGGEIQDGVIIVEPKLGPSTHRNGIFEKVQTYSARRPGQRDRLPV